MLVLEIIGYVAGFCTTVAQIPQIFHIVRTGSVKDISVYGYSIMCCGIALWGVYGFLMGSSSVVITNIIGLSCTGLVLALKIRDLWRNRSL